MTRRQPAPTPDTPTPALRSLAPRHLILVRTLGRAAADEWARRTTQS